MGPADIGRVTQVTALVIRVMAPALGRAIRAVPARGPMAPGHSNLPPTIRTRGPTSPRRRRFPAARVRAIDRAAAVPEVLGAVEVPEVLAALEALEVLAAPEALELLAADQRAATGAAPTLPPTGLRRGRPTIRRVVMAGPEAPTQVGEPAPSVVTNPEASLRHRATAEEQAPAAVEADLEAVAAEAVAADLEAVAAGVAAVVVVVEGAVVVVGGADEVPPRDCLRGAVTSGP